MKLALIGFGDLGHYIKEMLTDFNDVDETNIVYFDDYLADQNIANAKPFSKYPDNLYHDFDFYVCLGYKHLEKKSEIISHLQSIGRRVPNFIHPSSYVHPSVKIGDGTFIYPGCSIDRNTVIGKGVWIANADVIAHDCIIGDCNWFGASVTLSGKVSVGANTFIGSGSVISNDIEIGSNVIIGLGTVVTKNVENNKSVIGNPLRVLDKPLKLI